MTKTFRKTILSIITNNPVRPNKNIFEIKNYASEYMLQGVPSRKLLNQNLKLKIKYKIEALAFSSFKF